MTIADIAALLLNHFAPEERSIPDSVTYPGRNAEILRTINGALEEMYGLSSPWVAKEELGVILNPPTNVTLTVTENSVDAEISALEWKDWMAGCTIVLEGQEVDNQIKNNARQVVLKYPYDGASGTVTAKIYHDSIEIPTRALGIYEPVMIDGIQIPAVSHPSALVQTSSDRDFGFHRRSSSALIRRVASSASNPRTYSIDAWHPNNQTASVARMRLAPAPTEKAFLSYAIKLNPPVITNIASTNTLPVPHQYISSIFLPIAEKRLSASPFYRGVLSAESIAENYRMAIKQLEASNPRKNQGIRLFTRF